MQMSPPKELNFTSVKIINAHSESNDVIFSMCHNSRSVKLINARGGSNGLT